MAEVWKYCAISEFWRYTRSKWRYMKEETGSDLIGSGFVFFPSLNKHAIFPPLFLLETKRFAGTQNSFWLFGTMRFTEDIFLKIFPKQFSLIFGFERFSAEQNRFPSFKGGSIQWVSFVVFFRHYETFSQRNNCDFFQNLGFESFELGKKRFLSLMCISRVFVLLKIW